MFFNDFLEKYSPLAEKFKPESLENIRGQRHILGEGKVLNRILSSKKPLNLLFYGPPGTGKTQVARIVANTLSLPYVKKNACKLSQGEWKKTITKIVREGKGSVGLILDEIHRLNRLQQEFLLPYLETGELYLIGITTEHPFHVISKALLSRVLPLEFKKLSEGDILSIMKEALRDEERGLGSLKISVSDEILSHIAKISDGDARRALNYLEVLVMGKRPPIVVKWEDVESIGITQPGMSKSEFYDLISAFIKSMRVGDREATVYYLVRLLKAGVSYRYILRRMLIFAAEDIGLANPLALSVVQSGFDAFERTGEEEGKIILSMLAQYLALQRKSNDAIGYLKRVEKLINRGEFVEVPGFLKHGMRRTEKYINPHKDPKGALNQKYISDRVRDIIRGKEV